MGRRGREETRKLNVNPPVINFSFPSLQIILSVLGICAGTALASYGEINMSVLGVLIMFAAEVTEAVRLVLVQYLLKSLKFSIVESQYFLAPCSALALFSASMLLEFPSMNRNDAWAQVAAHPYLFLAAGTLGVGVHFLSFLVVQVTNSGERAGGAAERRARDVVDGTVWTLLLTPSLLRRIPTRQ